MSESGSAGGPKVGVVMGSQSDFDHTVSARTAVGKIDGDMRKFQGIQFLCELRFQALGQYDTATGRELACNRT